MRRPLGVFGTAMATRLQAILSSEHSGIATSMSRVLAGIVTDHIMTVKLGTVVFPRKSGHGERSGIDG